MFSPAPRAAYFDWQPFGLEKTYRIESGAGGDGGASGGIPLAELSGQCARGSDILIHPHEVYGVLGADAESRQAACRDLFRYKLEPGQVDEIRQATNGNYALGNALFAEQIGEAVGRRVNPGKAGRPRKRSESESGRLFD
jgi:hypothetical protein